MRPSQFLAITALAGLSMAPALWAQDQATGTEYTALELLAPCQTADNDARNGINFEIECEQYIMGFVGALREVGAKADHGICAPEVNTADEVRWAFMRWVHASYSDRTKMPAAKALMATLQQDFPCG